MPSALNTFIASPNVNILRQRDTWFTVENLHWHVIVTQSPWFTLGSTLDVVHSMGLDNYIMMFLSLWYHTEYSHCPKTPLYPSYSPLILPSTLWQPWFFYHLHSFAFLGCPVVKTIRYVAFSDWPLALNDMLLSFPHVISWLGSSWISVLHNIPLPEWATVYSCILLLWTP